MWVLPCGRGSEDIGWGASWVALMHDFQEPDSGRRRLRAFNTREAEYNPGRERGHMRESRGLAILASASCAKGGYVKGAELSVQGETVGSEL